MNDINEKKDIDEIEGIIEDRLKYIRNLVINLELEDINYYRREIYKEYGWDEDPYPEKREEEEYKPFSLYDRFSEVGMSVWDFVPRPY